MLMQSLLTSTPEDTVARLAERVLLAFVTEVFPGTVEMFVAVLTIVVYRALCPMAFQPVVSTEIQFAIFADVVPMRSKRVLGIVMRLLVAALAVRVRHNSKT